MNVKISEEQIASGTVEELEGELSLMFKSRKELARKLRIGRRIDLILDVFGETYNPKKEKKEVSISDMFDNGAMQITKGTYHGRPCDPDREFAMIHYGSIFGRLNGGNLVYFEFRRGNNTEEIKAFRTEERWLKNIYNLYGHAQDTRHKTKHVSVQERIMNNLKDNEKELGLFGIIRGKR